MKEYNSNCSKVTICFHSEGLRNIHTCMHVDYRLDSIDYRGIPGVNVNVITSDYRGIPGVNVNVITSDYRGIPGVNVNVITSDEEYQV